MHRNILLAVLILIAVILLDCSRTSGVDCASLSEAECKEDRSCSVYHVRKYDFDRECLEEPTVVCSKPKLSHCNMDIPPMYDAEGACYVVKEICGPYGWIEAKPRDPCHEMCERSCADLPENPEPCLHSDCDGDLCDGDEDAEGELEDDPGVYIAPGCEEFLIGGEEPESKFGNGSQLEEFIAARDSGDNFSWQLKLYSGFRDATDPDHFIDYSEEEIALRDYCFMEALAPTGLAVNQLLEDFFLIEGASGDSVGATYDIIEPFLQLKIVEYGFVGCTEFHASPLCACMGRDQAACEHSPFCQNWLGYTYDFGLNCWQERKFARCIQLDDCGADAESFVLSPDGTCFWFNGTCSSELRPEGWDSESETCNHTCQRLCGSTDDTSPCEPDDCDGDLCDGDAER